MNWEFFVARRLARKGKQQFSGLILRIAIVAIALSIAVMIVATAMISGFKKEIHAKLFGFWGHIHIMHAGVDHTLEAYPIAKTQDFYPDLNAVEEISYTAPFKLFGFEFPNIEITKKTKGSIKHIQPFAIKPAIIQTKEQLEGLVVKGVDKNYNWDYLQRFIVAGKALNITDSIPQSPYEVLISQITANRLNLEVGSSFIANFVNKGDQLKRRFKVCGIYNTGLEDYDKKFALADMRIIQRVLGWQEDQVAGFEVLLEDISDLNIYKEYILSNELPVELNAETLREKDPGIFDWLELQDINEMVILGLMIIVAIINTITALLIFILERTNMIGILKAVGARNWSIQRIFLYHAAYIILVGLFWGNIFGIGIAWLQDKFKFIRLSEADYYLNYAPVHLNLWTIVALNIGTLLLTVLILIIPSFFVKTISPVNAIRIK